MYFPVQDKNCHNDNMLLSLTSEIQPHRDDNSADANDDEEEENIEIVPPTGYC